MATQDLIKKIEEKRGQFPMTQQILQSPIQISQEQIMWKIISQRWK